jgi:ankyrin repeat protein
LLLQAGANARQAATTGVFLGKTPLMWASSQGRTEVVRMLLLAGVDVNHSSHVGNFKVIKMILYLVLTVSLYLFNSIEPSFVMILPC